MLLAEQGIMDFTDKIRSNQFNLKELRIKYNPDSKKPYALLNVSAANGIHQDDTYYDNLQENIIASNFSWFEPIIRAINVPLEATLNVDEEGNFDIKSIHIKFHLLIPKNVESIVAFLYNRLKPFVLFNEYIDSLQVTGYEGKITKLIFGTYIDATRVAKLLNEKQYNKAILEQWLSSINRCERENSGNKHFDNRFEVVSGKVNMEYKYELVSQYFGLTPKVIQKFVTNGEDT